MGEEILRFDSIILVYNDEKMLQVWKVCESVIYLSEKRIYNEEVSQIRWTGVCGGDKE